MFRLEKDRLPIGNFQARRLTHASEIVNIRRNVQSARDFHKGDSTGMIVIHHGRFSRHDKLRRTLTLLVSFKCVGPNVAKQGKSFLVGILWTCCFDPASTTSVHKL
ncbi:hypothetical protein KIN20_028950 [Parelaphostrongylus tenuis]|uniref:Uncharacterized protein n=1 Tax=Parelaphostrongylus tenuis TaxID=148309 RepID=A0AAD5R1J3_PARTN|nr:hypothetical protein KIN20_028950 [Parelaphostrongylus tenuis]